MQEMRIENGYGIGKSLYRFLDVLFVFEFFEAEIRRWLERAVGEIESRCPIRIIEGGRIPGLAIEVLDTKWNFRLTHGHPDRATSCLTRSSPGLCGNTRQ